MCGDCVGGGFSTGIIALDIGGEIVWVQIQVKLVLYQLGCVVSVRGQGKDGIIDGDCQESIPRDEGRLRT